MCFSKAPKVKPVAAAPTAAPSVIDSTAVEEKERFRRRSRALHGRQSTILSGDVSPPTAPVKTALGR